MWSGCRGATVGCLSSRKPKGLGVQCARLIAGSASLKWAETSVASGAAGAGAAVGAAETATQANAHQQGLTTTPVSAPQRGMRATSGPPRQHIAPLKQQRGVKSAADADLSFLYFEWRPVRRTPQNLQQ